jgi:hypothetical protein
MHQLPKIAASGIYGDDFQFWHSLATGVPGKPLLACWSGFSAILAILLIRGKVLSFCLGIYNRLSL